MKNVTEQKLTIEKIAHVLTQMKRIDNSTSAKITDLAKELGVKKTVLLDFIDNHATHFSLGNHKNSKNNTSILVVTNVFVDSADNKENEILYIEKRKSLYEKTIHLSAMDNYGCIEGYFIAPSSDKLERQFLNTEEKIRSLVQRFNLNPAQYWFGGLGDCVLIKPEGGFQISKSNVETLVSEGWKITPKELSWKK